MFLAKIPRQFIRKVWRWNKAFGVFINSHVEQPVEFTGTIPKFDVVVVTLHKELSKLMRDSGRMYLVRIHWWVKNSLCSMQIISDNNNFLDLGKSNCLINTTVDGKKLSFSESNIYCTINYFDGRFIVCVDVWDGCGNMIFDAHIRYDNSWEGIGRSCENNVIKIFNKNLDAFLPWMKGKFIRKGINRAIFWRKFLIEWIKRKKRFILLIVHVDEGTT